MKSWVKSNLNVTIGESESKERGKEKEGESRMSRGIKELEANKNNQNNWLMKMV